MTETEGDIVKRFFGHEQNETPRINLSRHLFSSFSLLCKVKYRIKETKLCRKCH